MEQHYSTLELVKYDETARAPERDYDATAAEFDASALAPQVVPDTTPQVSYDCSLPEAHGQIEDSPKESTSGHLLTKAALKWPWMVVALVDAAATALGVGLGTWRHHKHSSNKSSTAIRPSVPQYHNNTAAAQHILNDTSLAALVLSNGDRQLFFQDNTGRIRRAVRTASNNQWSTSLSLNVTTGSSGQAPNPKNNTPLAATADYSGTPAGVLVQLYYVSDSHHLVSASADGGLQDPGLFTYITALDTRSLSVTTIPRPRSTTYPQSPVNLALLYFENPSGNMSVLLQRGYVSNIIYQHDIWDDGWPSWFDITSQKSQSLPAEFRNSADQSDFGHTMYEADANTIYSTPFTSRTNFTTSDSVDAITAVFYAPPDSEFSFTRLASATGSDLLLTYLYHLINGTTFAEEQHDRNANAWIGTEYITISDS